APHAAAAGVAVALLGPELDRPPHLDPERGVREPALQRRLVERRVGSAVHDADHEDGALHPAAVALVEATQELLRILPGRAEGTPDARRQLVHRPRVPGAEGGTVR